MHGLSKLVLFLIFLGMMDSKAVPSTDISLYRIIKAASGIELEYSKPLVKRNGYDNQPSFDSLSKTIFYTRMNEQNRTDIWSVDLMTGKKKQLSFSEENEYSPTPLSQSNQFSVVIEHQGKQNLRLLDSGKLNHVLSGAIEPVGYHAWVSEQYLAFFRLAEPHELVLFDRETQSQKLLAKDIGRCLVPKKNDRDFFYVQNTAQAKQIIRYSLIESRKTPLLDLFSGSEDFSWQSDIGFITSDGAYFYTATESDPEWKQIPVLNSIKIGGISRLAISPNGQWLAVVHLEQ